MMEEEKKRWELLKGKYLREIGGELVALLIALGEEISIDFI